MKQNKVDLETVFEDFHIGSNSGGGWFVGGLLSSQRFWDDFENNDMESMLENFLQLLNYQGNKLDNKKLTTIFEDAGVPKDSDLYAYAGAGSYIDEEEPWREVVHALFENEFKGTNKDFKFASWTSLSILLKHANTESFSHYDISFNGSGKELSYPVMLHYNNDRPVSDVPGITNDVKIENVK
eukprot:UN31495